MNKIIIFKIYICKKLFHKNRNILIEVDISQINYNRGPGSYIQGINHVLPFIWGNCSFISSTEINNDLSPNFHFFPFPNFKIRNYKKYIKTGLINKFILGPVFVPKKWNSFPNHKLWIERKFPDLLKLTKGIAVHSLRVRDYLANKSGTTKNLNKFIIIRPCTNLKPLSIKNFKHRKIDIVIIKKK